MGLGLELDSKSQSPRNASLVVPRAPGCGALLRLWGAVSPDRKRSRQREVVGSGGGGWKKGTRSLELWRLQSPLRIARQIHLPDCVTNRGSKTQAKRARESSRRRVPRVRTLERERGALLPGSGAALGR